MRMVYDRGKKKWQPAFFMPEHVKLLKQIPKEDTRQKKPELDEQKLYEIGITVMESLNYTVPINLTVWHDGIFESVTGIVHKVDMLMRYILIEIDDGEKSKIFVNTITAAERN
jgi:hypothetical protein